uniref:Uncharacterized protein n=1 Tax=Marseillevirus LCMAC101 TaxID=2506602 RepID=A0A481YS38_9VIRU|nr:MAG: hypothetical protein LCMAC101_03520 [Marseillevirus LCMAC101]
MSDITMSDYKEPLEPRIKKLENQVTELQDIISNMTGMLLEMKTVLDSTRHKTNEHITDLYGAIDHVVFHGRNYNISPRQKIPVKHYV